MTRTPLTISPIQNMMKNVARGQLYDAIGRQVEERVERLVNSRHNYPMWPERDIENIPMDAFERQYHEEIRKSYYQETIFLIQLARQLREVN